MSKKPAAKTAEPKRHNRIWIELDVPANNADAELQCTLANNMLKRLVPSGQFEFWWHENDCMYCLSTGPMGYHTLPDRGHWFNLDSLGKE